MKDFYEAPEVISPDMEAELIFVAPEGTPFWKKLLMYCAVWLAVILVACGLTYSIMSQYEAALPATTMDNYLVSSRQDMFYFAISKDFDKIGNRFESAYSIASTLSKEYNGELTYSKLATEYTEENPVYIIQHNGEKLFKVTLEYGEETGFMNFREYNVKNVELLKDGLFNFKSYKVVFASNMLVHINETSLGTNLDEFEKIDIFGHDGYYGLVVEDFAYEPKVLALSYEYADAPDKVVTAKRVGDFYIFEDGKDSFYTVTVTAPADAVVSIDKKVVSELFITKRYSEVIGGGDIPTDLVVYTVPTVYEAKNIAVSLGGKAMNIVREGLSFTALPESATCTVKVPHGAQLYFNGNWVDGSKITNGNAVWHSDFEDIRKYPTATEYTLSGIVSSASLSATLNGEWLVAHRDGSGIVFTSLKSDVLAAQYSTAAIEFVNQYLYYSAQGSSNTATNLANTLKLVYPASPLHNYLTLAKVGIEYKSPQTVMVEYISADNFYPYGSDAFVCDVTYKALLNDSITEVTEENVIHLVFIKNAYGNFLPAKFIL